MNPEIFANPQRVNQFILDMPHVEPAFGKHRASRSQETADSERGEFLTANRQILPGFGKHRLTRNDYVLVPGRAA